VPDPGQHPSPPQRRFTDDRQGFAGAIGGGMAIKGTIRGSTDLEIWGSFDGDMKIDGLVWLRPGGRFVGDMVTTDLIVEGELRGTVRGDVGGRGPHLGRGGPRRRGQPHRGPDHRLGPTRRRGRLHRAAGSGSLGGGRVPDTGRVRFDGCTRKTAARSGPLSGNDLDLIQPASFLTSSTIGGITSKRSPTMP
jgi:hypothetical protein